jgi:hypothetical protein
MNHNFSDKNLESYSKEFFDKIQGWTPPELIIILDLINKENIDDGGCAEFNAYHGKFLLALNSLSTSNAESYLYFDDKVDFSDYDLRTLNHNLITYDFKLGKNINFLKIYENTFPQPLNKVKYFSINSRTSADTLNAIRFAESIISDNGVIFVHDFLNSGMIGILEGVTRYLSDENHNLRPFAIGLNCIYLSKKSGTEYKEVICNSLFKTKTLEFYGNEILEISAA